MLLLHLLPHSNRGGLSRSFQDAHKTHKTQDMRVLLLRPCEDMRPSLLPLGSRLVVQAQACLICPGFFPVTQLLTSVKRLGL